MKISIDKILPNPEQPRSGLDQDELETLADSIKQHGLINPIAVEEAGDSYILIDGERRWRAAKLAGFKEIEASVRPANNGQGSEQRLTWAMVANLQRVDMNHLEEARALLQLKHHGKSNQEISELVGMSVALIANRMALLDLEPEIQELVISKRLTDDRQLISALLNIPDTDLRVRLAKRMAGSGMATKAMTSMIKRVADGMNFPAGGRRLGRGPKPRCEYDKWSMLKAVPETPDHMKAAAIATCNNCPLYEDASAANCRDCPAVELLRRLAKEAGK
jgi:ParB family transcriptional regulator, chromosome partitioning protein